MHPQYAVRKKRLRLQRKPGTNIKATVQSLELQSFTAQLHSPAHNEYSGISASSPASLQFSHTQPPIRRYKENAVPCVTQHYTAIYAEADLMHLMLLYMQALIAKSQSLRAHTG